MFTRMPTYDPFNPSGIVYCSTKFLEQLIRTVENGWDQHPERVRANIRKMAASCEELPAYLAGARSSHKVNFFRARMDLRVALAKADSVTRRYYDQRFQEFLDDPRNYAAAVEAYRQDSGGGKQRSCFDIARAMDALEDCVAHCGLVATDQMEAATTQKGVPAITGKFPGRPIIRARQRHRLEYWPIEAPFEEDLDCVLEEQSISHNDWNRGYGRDVNDRRLIRAWASIHGEPDLIAIEERSAKAFVLLTNRAELHFSFHVPGRSVYSPQYHWVAGDWWPVRPPELCVEEETAMAVYDLEHPTTNVRQPMSVGDHSHVVDSVTGRRMDTD